MTTPEGEIRTFLAAVGHGPEATKDIASLVTLLVDEQPEKEQIDESTYWSYADTGVELEWIGPVLRTAHLFVVGDADHGYAPYPRDLFQGFANDAARDQVVAVLGAPEASGDAAGGWIRYVIDGTSLHFSFDEDTDTVTMITVGVPLTSTGCA